MTRVILFAALLLAGVVPAYADGWTDWRTFASHNGVVLEWRTYSHPEHDTMADWRVRNNSTEALFFLFLGTRTYKCSSGSDAFPHLRQSLPGDVGLWPGDSVTLSDGGAANYVRADHVNRAECPRIVEAAFDKGVSWALEFSVGSPHALAKPWMEHTFAAAHSEAARRLWTVTCRASVTSIEENWSDPIGCIEYTTITERAYSAIRDWSREWKYLPFFDSDIVYVSCDAVLDGAACLRDGLYACDHTSNDDMHVYQAGINRNEIHKIISYDNRFDETEERFNCEEGGGTFLGRQ